MTTEARLVLLFLGLSLSSLLGAFTRGLAPAGVLLLVISLAGLLAAQRKVISAATFLFVGEPLCLLSGPDLLLILLAHVFLLGLYLELAESPTERGIVLSCATTALLALPIVLVLPSLPPLHAILLPVAATGMMVAYGYLSTRWLQVRLRGVIP